ncbi:hypothetical protein LTR50_002522 [Elasticomyces elasticus]|nr:hypothetical protein LTR50_002522 [Elasticomyces elasticus]
MLPPPSPPIFWASFLLRIKAENRPDEAASWAATLQELSEADRAAMQASADGDSADQPPPRYLCDQS